MAKYSKKDLPKIKEYLLANRSRVSRLFHDAAAYQLSNATDSRLLEVLNGLKGESSIVGNAYFPTMVYQGVNELDSAVFGASAADPYKLLGDRVSEFAKGGNIDFQFIDNSLGSLYVTKTNVNGNRAIRIESIKAAGSEGYDREVRPSSQSNSGFAKKSFNLISEASGLPVLPSEVVNPRIQRIYEKMGYVSEDIPSYGVQIKSYRPKGLEYQRQDISQEGKQGFEYGQKFISPKTGESASLVTADTKGGAVLETLKGDRIALSPEQYKKLSVKAPAALIDLKRGDGLIVDSKGSQFNGQRYTVMGSDTDKVQLRSESGDIRLVPKDKIASNFRPNSLGFATYPALNTMFGASALGLTGFAFGKALAQKAGLNEDQQNIVGGIGAGIGGLTGSGLGLVPTLLSGELDGVPTRKFNPNLKDLATTVLFGNPVSQRRIGLRNDSGVVTSANPQRVSMANKKIANGSISTTYSEPSRPKLTSDILENYLRMMGGEPALIKPDGSQYNPDRKSRVIIGDRMTTAEKFGQSADIGLNNEYQKLPEIHTRFDDRKLALQVQKEIATGRLTTQKFYETPDKAIADQAADEIRRSPELLDKGETVEVRKVTGGYEVAAVKQYQPVPSRGNSPVRSYGLENDPAGVFVALNKPEEAYKAPKSLKELQAEARSMAGSQSQALAPDTRMEFTARPQSNWDKLQIPNMPESAQKMMQMADSVEPSKAIAAYTARDTGGWANAVGEPFNPPRSNSGIVDIKPARFAAEMGLDTNPTGLSDRGKYNKVAATYADDNFGLGDRLKPFPDFYELQRQAKAEGVRDEAFQNYIKGRADAPLIEAGIMAKPELPMTARLGQEYISPKSGKVATIAAVGKTGVKMVDASGQPIRVEGAPRPDVIEYKTLEKLKYTGNKGYGFAIPALLTTQLGATAGGLLGYGFGKRLAKQFGLNEDQQNIAGGVGAGIGTITGSAIGAFPMAFGDLPAGRTNFNLRIPTAKELAVNLMFGGNAVSQSRYGKDFGQIGSINPPKVGGARNWMPDVVELREFLSRGSKPYVPASMTDVDSLKQAMTQAESLGDVESQVNIAKQLEKVQSKRVVKKASGGGFGKAKQAIAQTVQNVSNAALDILYQPTKSRQPNLFEQREAQKLGLTVDQYRANREVSKAKVSERIKFTAAETIKNREADSQFISRLNEEANSARSKADILRVDSKPDSDALKNLAARESEVMKYEQEYESKHGKRLPSKATQPKPSNFIAESAVESAAKSSGATTSQVKAAIASQRSSGQTVDLGKATDAAKPQIAKQRSLQGVTLPEPRMQLSGLNVSKPIDNGVGRQAAFERFNLAFDANAAFAAKSTDAKPSAWRSLPLWSEAPKPLTIAPTQSTPKQSSVSKSIPSTTLQAFEGSNAASTRNISQPKSATVPTLDIPIAPIAKRSLMQGAWQTMSTPVAGRAGMIGDRGMKVFGGVVDATQAVEAFSQSVGRGESGELATARAAATVGTYYGATAAAGAVVNAYGLTSLAKLAPVPAPVKAGLMLAAGIGAAMGADDAISNIVGIDKAKQGKYQKDMSKLGLSVDPTSEQYEPFGKAAPDRQTNNLAKAGEYVRGAANLAVDSTIGLPEKIGKSVGRSLADLSNKDSIQNARYASERDASIKAGMDAKSSKSIAFEDRGNGVTAGIMRDRGYNATESRVLALQNLANENGFEVARSGKWNVKLNEALDKLGYSNDQISQYLNGKTKTIGAPPAKQTNQQSGQQALAVRSQLGKVTSGDLSSALSVERQKLGLKGGETLSYAQVSGVFKSLKDMKRSANPIQSKPLQRFGAAVGIGK